MSNSKRIVMVSNNMQSIVLVGNGPAAIERKSADIIESYDQIVRFNNFTTEGYEEYVGTRTNIWATRICGTIKQRNPNDFDEIIGVINHCKYTHAIFALAPSWVGRYPDLNIIYSQQVSKYADIFDYNPMKNWLSVGMIVLLHLLDYGYKKVHLYGFGGDVSKHYFELPPKDEHFHNFDVEHEHIAKLEESGKVVRI